MKNQCVTRQDSDSYFYSYNYQIYKREDIDIKNFATVCRFQLSV